MPPSGSWALHIKVFSIFILVAAIVHLGLSFWARTANWLGVANSLMFVAVGILGLYSGFKKTKFVASLFFISCLGSFAISIIIYITELIYVNGWVNEYCNTSDMSGADCHAYRNFRWVFAIGALIAAIPSCCCCLFFSYSYMLQLEKDRQPRAPDTDPNPVTPKKEDKKPLLSDY